ncbi:MAG: DUF3299 domain-containing protein [Pseudomonadota bacterium]
MTWITRRRFALSAAAALAAGHATRASAKPLELDWGDLIPESENGTHYDEMRTIMGIIEHSDLTSGFFQNRDASVTTEYNGQRVRLPGFMVPLDFQNEGVTVLLLVPYVGACIHVPPPPPNQIVLVRATKPYGATGYFQAIYVTGTIAATAKPMGLADVGYEITEAEIEPYEDW